MGPSFFKFSPWVPKPWATHFEPKWLRARSVILVVECKACEPSQLCPQRIWCILDVQCMVYANYRNCTLNKLYANLRNKKSLVVCSHPRVSPQPPSSSWQRGHEGGSSQQGQVSRPWPRRRPWYRRLRRPCPWQEPTCSCLHAFVPAPYTASRSLVCLSIDLAIYISIYLSIYPSIDPSTDPSIHVPTLRSIDLSIELSTGLSIHQTIDPSIDLLISRYADRSIYRPIDPSIESSIHRSIRIPFGR